MSQFLLNSTVSSCDAGSPQILQETVAAVTGVRLSVPQLSGQTAGRQGKTGFAESSPWPRLSAAQDICHAAAR
jgi:hypothetical protein